VDANKVCKRCGKLIQEEYSICPFCGKRQNPPQKRIHWVGCIIAGILLIAVAAGYFSGTIYIRAASATPAPTAQPTATTTDTPAPSAASTPSPTEPEKTDSPDVYHLVDNVPLHDFLYRIHCDMPDTLDREDTSERVFHFTGNCNNEYTVWVVGRMPYVKKVVVHFSVSKGKLSEDQWGALIDMTMDFKDIMDIAVQGMSKGKNISNTVNGVKYSISGTYSYIEITADLSAN
jgi:hypothetical protein